MNNPPKTPIDICNMALARLGEPHPIAALNPAGLLPSRLCCMHYHPIRREVICARKWDFATRNVTLDQSGTLPMDALRVLAVSAPKWTLKGRTICCQPENVQLEYLADVEDVEAFSEDFVNALTLCLAIKLCIPLTNSTTTRQMLTEEYNNLMMP